MNSLATILLAGLAAAAAPPLQVSSDRHEGFYRFAPAPQEYCIARAREHGARPARPQRLADLPKAYAIRLTATDQKAAPACFRIEREPQE